MRAFSKEMSKNFQIRPQNSTVYSERDTLRENCYSEVSGVQNWHVILPVLITIPIFES